MMKEQLSYGEKRVVYKGGIFVGSFNAFFLPFVAFFFFLLIEIVLFVLLENIATQRKIKYKRRHWQRTKK